MASSLLRLADNLAIGINNSNCKDCKTFLKYVEVSSQQVINTCCLRCNQNHGKYLEEN